jgi:hypothetical protein
MTDRPIKIHISSTADTVSLEFEKDLKILYLSAEQANDLSKLLARHAAQAGFKGE